jgi:hypothetical protein
LFTHDLRPISAFTGLKSGARHVALLHVLHRLSKNPRNRSFAGQEKLGLYLAEKTGRAKPYSERQIRRLLTDLAADGAIEIERPDRTEQNLIRVAIGANELEAAIAGSCGPSHASKMPAAGPGQACSGAPSHASKNSTKPHEPLASEREIAADQGKPCMLMDSLRARRILYRWKLELPTAYRVVKKLGVDNLRYSTVRFLGVDNGGFSTAGKREILCGRKSALPTANVRSNVRSTRKKMSARHMETLDNRQYETELRPFRPVRTTTTAAPEFVDGDAQREPDVVVKSKPKTTAEEVAAKITTRLVTIGVAVKVAAAIANSVSPQSVITQLASLPYRATKSNRAGLLVQSIRDDFPVPDSARGAVSYALREWAALLAPPAAATAEKVAAAAEVADVDVQLLEAMSADEKTRLERRAREDLDAHLEEKNLRRMIRPESPAYGAMLQRRMLDSAAAIAGGASC